jgi:hypothetical protein
MTMKTIITALILLSGTTAFSQEDLADNIKKYGSAWGAYCKPCGDLSSQSYTVKLRNVGKEKLDVKVAVQEKNKSWKVFNFTAMAPNDSMIAYACQGTGKFLKWARKAGDNSTTFPTDKQINDEYKD